jgi:uncharacterized protein (DUF433 family)
LLEQAIDQGRFAMINMGDNSDIPYMLHNSKNSKASRVMCPFSRKGQVLLGTSQRTTSPALECTPKPLYNEPVIATNYRYIVRAPGVRSGNPIVEGTRIGVHDVVATIQLGATIDQVVASFPRLTRAQVYECLAYYEDHKSEIDPLVASQIAHVDE